MVAEKEARDKLWARLAEPFPPEEIERLPKLIDRNDQRKARCQANSEQGRYVSADGHYCGGWHARSVHLSYVGHAGITMRLNEVVGPDNWDWEPVAVDADGLPYARGGEFWIRLTVLGVSKYGVGDDFHGSSKQAIGDALRNAAMRFGIGTYLWSKSDKAGALAEFTPPAEDSEQPPVQGRPLAQAPGPGPETGYSAGSVPPTQPAPSATPPQAQPAGPDPAAGTTAPAAGEVNKEAQALVDTASRARTYNTLKTLHGQAHRKGILNAEVVHPTASGAMTTVAAYLQERKAELPQPEGQA